MRGRETCRRLCFAYRPWVNWRRPTWTGSSTASLECCDDIASVTRASAFASAGALESSPCFGPLPPEERRHAIDDSGHTLRERKGDCDVAADAQHVTHGHEAYLLHPKPRRHDEDELPGGLGQTLENQGFRKSDGYSEEAQGSPGFDAFGDQACELPCEGPHQSRRRTQQKADRRVDIGTPHPEIRSL